MSDRNQVTAGQAWLVSVLLMLQLAASVFIATRESAGVEAKGAVHGYAAALGAYQVGQIDADTRIRVLEGQLDWLRKALWQEKWPDVPVETLKRLQELCDESDGNPDDP